MGERGKFFDPIALAVAAGIGILSFVLIPGIGTAIGAAIGIALLAYVATLGVRMLRSSSTGAPKPAVGAGSEAAAPTQLKRGSAADIWRLRGTKALEHIDAVAAGCTQPVIRGQLENVAIESRDSVPVLDELALQAATMQRAIDEAAADQGREHEGQNARRDVVRRLSTTRDDLVARMQTIVLGLERVHSEMIETTATVATATDTLDGASDAHLRDLSDQLAGLRAGLEETRQYTQRVLGEQ